MKLPSSPLERNLRCVAGILIQMTIAVILFLVFCGLSADGKPAVDDSVCGYEACPQLEPGTFNVHLIPHSHDDVGWLKTPDQYYFENVQNIISSVVDALNQNPDRRFVQVETAFFKKWWSQQTDRVKQSVQKLVNNGQLEFINAAWSMNDEAAVHYQSTIDQFTLGLRYIQDNLGECARPKVGWQIDPFGHSREQASISAQLGFDSLFFARVDYRDRSRRYDDKAMDLLWKGSASLGNASDIFTSVLYRHYSAPSGFCFDIVCNDDIIIDDEESPDYNLQNSVEKFADIVRDQAQHYPTDNILVTMGDDFRYEAAFTTYLNLDRLIKGFEIFNQTIDGKRINVFYSTPSCYAKAVNDYVIANNINLEQKSDDFFPYADGGHTYWTGYFTSRPASKHFERQGNNLLQVVKQLAADTQELYDDEQINSLKEAVGVMQHHDAITGTEKQNVAKNYHMLLAKGMQNANSKAGQILSSLISGSDSDFQFDSCLLANVSACDATKSDNFIVAVYNPLSHKTTTIVTLPVFFEQQSWQVLDPDDNVVSYQIDQALTDFSYVEDADTSQTTIQFAATDVPALGYKVYRLQATDSKNKQVRPNPRVVVGYEDTSFEISEITGLLDSVTMNGVTINVTQDFQYYRSRDASGAYIFIPDSDATSVASGPISTTLVRGDVSQGVIQEFAPWLKQFIKVYNDDRSFIEFDWIVGPIDISEKGREIITKYTTPLASDGIFYTDANGRETLTRQRNHRNDYTYTDEEPVSGNYFPVNNRISLRDEQQDVELAIITDRSEGGSSLNDGELELMVHRACHSDDGRGVGEILNEQEYGDGIRVRGKHYLVVGPRSTIAATKRDIAQRKTVQPWTFVSNTYGELNTLQFSGLRNELPPNVHILTLEPWDQGVLLLRFEHIFEEGEDEELSQEVTVDVSELFTLFTVTELRETTLGANMLLEERVRLSWPGSTDKRKVQRRDVDDLTVILRPMEIRTFLATVTYT